MINLIKKQLLLGKMLNTAYLSESARQEDLAKLRELSKKRYFQIYYKDRKIFEIWRII
jgi:hypothetical protein